MHCARSLNAIQIIFQPIPVFVATYCKSGNENFTSEIFLPVKISRSTVIAHVLLHCAQIWMVNINTVIQGLIQGWQLLDLQEGGIRHVPVV